MNKEKISPKEISRKRKREEFLKEQAYHNRLDRYHEMQTQVTFDRRRSNWVCLECRKTAKLLDYADRKKEYPAKCPHCGEYALNKIGVKLRVPRKNASNKKWKDFENNHHLRSKLK